MPLNAPLGNTGTCHDDRWRSYVMLAHTICCAPGDAVSCLTDHTWQCRKCLPSRTGTSESETWCSRVTVLCILFCASHGVCILHALFVKRGCTSSHAVRDTTVAHRRADVAFVASSTSADLFGVDGRTLFPEDALCLPPRLLGLLQPLLLPARDVLCQILVTRAAQLVPTGARPHSQAHQRLLVRMRLSAQRHDAAVMRNGDQLMTISMRT